MRYVKLCEVCEKASSSIAQKDLADNVGQYDIYGASGYIKSVDFYHQSNPYIAVVKDGAGIGRTMMLPAKTSIIGTMQYILPKENIDVRYLYYALISMNLSRFYTGATIPHIYFKDYQNEQLPLPDYERQTEISSIMDKASTLISLRKQQITKLDELIKCRFLEMFGDFKTNSKGWEIAFFNDFAIIDGNMTTDYEKYADYPHIGIDCIEKDTGIIKGYRTVKEDGVKSGKYLFTPNHIIYSKIRPNLNKVALPNFNGVCSADAYPIIPINNKSNREFLAYTMRSLFFLDYILQFCNRTNLPKVNRKEVSGFKTPLPPIQLQSQFADFVQQVDKSKSVLQQSLDEAEILYKSLMQKYFG